MLVITVRLILNSSGCTRAYSCYIYTNIPGDQGPNAAMCTFAFYGAIISSTFNIIARDLKRDNSLQSGVKVATLATPCIFEDDSVRAERKNCEGLQEVY